MSLYVRVFTSFYDHLKTMRLRVAIGDDAYWVPPKLWAYAAKNRPDGCFEKFTAAEIAMAIGYTKDASSMLQALLQAGFMDENPLRIHDWAEHNGYHKTYSDRASKAAKARWEKEELTEDRKGADLKGDKHCSTHASSIQQAPEDFLLSQEPSSKPRKDRPSEASQCVEYAQELGLLDPVTDGNWFWDKGLTSGWNIGGKAMRDWRAAMRTWNAKGYFPSQTPNNRKRIEKQEVLPVPDL